jgi:glycosyltransferase involved in cell wall biosynthesis
MRALQNVIQYDAAANEDPREQGFGFNKFKEYVDTVTPNIIMIYNDPIVVNQFLNAIKDVPKTYKIWVYLDQVYEGCDQGLLRTIEKGSDRILVFTQKWKDHLLTRIPATDTPIDVLEHGVDMSVFKRSSDPERLATRTQLNIPSDATVFLNVNRNSERKRLDLSVMAFARLIKKNPDMPLFLVFVATMNPQAGGHYSPIHIFLNELKLAGLDNVKYGNRIVCVDNAPPKMLDDKTIVSIYSACDYGLNTSNGEGFGLCQLEHLACGGPQVVIDTGDYRAFMTNEVAEIVDPTVYAYLPVTAGIGMTMKSAHPDEVADAMHRILSNKNIEGCVKIASGRPWSTATGFCAA